MEKTPLQVEPIDPLRRVFVPVEKRTLDGTWVFKTTDGSHYTRNPKTGAIRNLSKLRGAGKESRKARRQTRAAHAHA